jgi:hypothetical protein
MKRGESHANRATGDRIGSGKAAGEDGREEKGRQMSKDEGKSEQFLK